jgi:sulfite reductase (NADPH) flavoprotein alpha-component
MAAYPDENLPSEQVLLIITSTYGDGEPPDNAADLHAFLHSTGAPKFDRTRFAVFALGDSEYPDFCACGKQLDARLEELGAERLTARVDADVDFDAPFAEWQSLVFDRLAATLAA